MSDVVVGLDIGTSFIRTAIGEITDDNRLEIIGVATRPSAGLRNGVIVNIEAAMAVIKETVAAAEQTAGYEVSSCVTALGGAQIESLNSGGVAGIPPRGRSNREITQQDKDRAIEIATNVAIPMDREILHVIPQEYSVDGITGIKDPLHMIGVRLEVQVHIISASKTAIQNIRACVSRAGYALDNVMLKTLAATQAVMHEDEMELGSILIDLGAGTTDALMLIHGAPVCTASIAVGGNLVTSDIAIVKGIPAAAAEKIKVEKGCCWLPCLETVEEVIIPGVGGRPPEMSSQAELCDIIQPRMEEIFEMIRSAIIHKTSIKQISGNIILTGGGAQMPGAVELAQQVWGTTNVRIGLPPENLGAVEKEFHKAEYATVIGLVMANKDSGAPENSRKNSRKHEEKGREKKESLFEKFKKSFF